MGLEPRQLSSKTGIDVSRAAIAIKFAERRFEIDGRLGFGASSVVGACVGLAALRRAAVS